MSLLPVRQVGSYPRCPPGCWCGLHALWRSPDASDRPTCLDRSHPGAAPITSARKWQLKPRRLTGGRRRLVSRARMGRVPTSIASVASAWHAQQTVRGIVGVGLVRWPLASVLEACQHRRLGPRASAARAAGRGGGRNRDRATRELHLPNPCDPAGGSLMSSADPRSRALGRAGRRQPRGRPPLWVACPSGGNPG